VINFKARCSVPHWSMPAKTFVGCPNY